MRIKLGLLAMAAASLLASGCQIYFGDHGDDDDQCAYPATDPGVAIPVQQARNPYTGECVTSGGGGGGGGGGCTNGGYATPDSPPPTGAGDALWFDSRWPVCENQCNALPESQCVIADGCRAIYVAGPTGAAVFSTCWATTSDGPIRGGDCSAITDAFQCAQHDDCAAFHDSIACGPNEDCATSRPGSFVSCFPEPGVVTGVCRVDTDCQTGEVCNLTDYCEPDPSCTPGAACPPVCWGKCVPWTPPPPPPPPASCTGLDEDTCIDMADGCIDTGSAPSCADLKCEPIYAGSNCDCTPAGCTCQSWTYQSCQSL